MLNSYENEGDAVAEVTTETLETPHGKAETKPEPEAKASKKKAAKADSAQTGGLKIAVAITKYYWMDVSGDKPTLTERSDKLPTTVIDPA